MRDADALDNNPNISLQELESLHGDLYGWCLYRCHYGAAAAEDLMQQVYVEVLSGRARFDERSSLKTFLFGIANNLARSRLRRLKTRLRLLEVWSSSPGTAAAADQSADSAPERVWIAVKALPPRQRDVVELVFCRDMTIEEASSVMGVSVGTARTHYERAKKALASELHTLREYIAGGGSP